MVVPCEGRHFPVHLKLLHYCSHLHIPVNKATGPDVILQPPLCHSTIISHWGFFFHDLFLSLEEGSSKCMHDGVPVDYTVWHHITPDRTLRSNGCENLCVTWLTYYSWVPQAWHPQHMTAESFEPHILNIWQLSHLSLTSSTYDSWVARASHPQHMTAELLEPHILNIWQLSPSSLTSSTHKSSGPQVSQHQHLTAESLEPHILNIWQLSRSSLTSSIYD
jgi:hypothetical protein